MYTPPNSHSPRKSAARGRSRAGRTGGTMRTTARPSPRPTPTYSGGGGGGGSTVRLVGNGGSVTVAVSGSPEYIRSDTDRRTRAQLRPAPAPKYQSYATTQARVDKAVQQAFPRSKYLPVQSPWTNNNVGRALGWGTAAVAAVEAAKEVENAASVIAMIMGGAWSEPGGAPVLAPGFNFVGVRQHSNFRAYGTSPRSGREGESYQIGNPLPVPENNWLGWTQTNPPPPNPWGVPSWTEVPANHFWLKTVEDYGYLLRFGLHRFWRKVEVYYNSNPFPAVPMVQPNAFPLPLGAPLPMGNPAGYPVNRPQTRGRPRPLTRPVRIDEVTVVVRPGRPPRVVKSPPRKPGPKATEKKSYGKSGVASAAFWLYENVQDWTDWVNIVYSAIPFAPPLNSPTAQARWLAENPEALISARWQNIIAGMAGWFVDEAFGAFVGNIHKKTSRATSSGTTVDIRQNVALHYGQSGASPGSFVNDFILAFL